jgi:LCP family protein required for cell wall assembly
MTGPQRRPGSAAAPGQRTHGPGRAGHGHDFDAAVGERTQAVGPRERRPRSDAAADERTQITTGHQGRRRSPEPDERAQGVDRAAGERTQAVVGRRGERAGSPAPPDGTPTPDEAAVEATTRVKRIDETLTRLTAAHAGLTLGATRDDPADAPDDAPAKVRPNLLRVAAVAVTALIVMATGVGWGAQRWLAAAVPSAAALDPGSGAIVDASAQAGDENVLLVATDRATTPGATARPDTVAVAHIPAGGGAMTVLAIPADLEVARPPCERYDAATTTYTSDTVPAQARTQLASALDLGGPRCATRAVQQLTGLAITRYVGLDLARLGDAVSALSGVRFCTPRAVVDSALGPVVPTPGTVSLDAGKATDFARASAVEGDPAAGRGRIERQQQVLAAVLGPALSDTGLLDLRRVAALRPALGHALTTDAADLDQVLALANGMRDLGATGVTFTPVPTDPDPADQGSVLRAGEAATLFDALRTDAPLPAAATGAAAGPRPSDLTVQVANASDRPGVAGKVADTLRGLGFRIGDVTNAAQPTSQTLIRYSPDQTAAAQLLATTVPAATTVPDPGATGVLQLVLGRSFDGVVRAPTTTPSGSAEPAPAAPPATASCA